MNNVALSARLHILFSNFQIESRIHDSISNHLNAPGSERANRDNHITTAMFDWYQYYMQEKCLSLLNISAN